MTNDILLRCPECRVQTRAQRQDYDPPTAVELTLRCAECTGGDFSCMAYYDSQGREVYADPESPDFGRPVAEMNA